MAKTASSHHERYGAFCTGQANYRLMHGPMMSRAAAADPKPPITCQRSFGPERGQAAGTNLPPPHGVAGPATARLNFVFSTGHPNKRATAVLTECMSAGVTNEVNGERSMRAALKANRTSGRRANINHALMPMGRLMQTQR
jgi:hypothetical protein